MKVGSGVIHYKNHQDYINSKSLGKSASETVKNEGLNKTLDDASKTDLSSKSKKLGDEIKDAAKKASDVVTEPIDKIKDKGKESSNLGKKLLGEAASTLTRAFKTPGVTNIGIPNFSSASDVGEIEEAKKVEAKSKTIHRPAIMFVGGFSINPFNDGMDGLKGISSHLPSSEYYSWDDEDKIIDEILKRDMSQPVILVGHGMGGDTAVSVTEKLNTLENGFRRIDLLMTLDSIGMENDIIPQNVRKNVNIISDADYFFNDGPNVARNKEITNVINELRPEAHADLETSTDIHFKIFEEVQDVLGLDTVDKILEFNRIKSRTNQNLKDSLRKPSSNQIS